MRTYTIASFSSIMLTMVSVLMLFLEVTVESVIPEHVDAFRIMFHIIGLLRAGPVDALKHAESLRVLFANHMEAVVKLYGDYVKPKGHQAFHIVDGMYALDRLLSCFVTERKHKIIKSAAVYVFRHLEHTVLQDVLSTHMRQITDGHDLYSATFLICPFDVILGGIAFRRARSGCVRIGHVSAGDLVITTDGRVGKILSLWQRVADEHTFLEVDSYPSINNDTRFRATTRATKDFLRVLSWLMPSSMLTRAQGSFDFRCQPRCCMMLVEPCKSDYRCEDPCSHWAPLRALCKNRFVNTDHREISGTRWPLILKNTWY